jgi:serine/threonine-protein kinase
MGVVYRAVDTRTGGLVAIKTMHDISDSRTVEMFKKEWHVLAQLCHPNIVAIRDVDEVEENGVRKPCFIMPLLPGVTLAALIKSSSRRLTVEKIVGMLCQVCSGLEAAHKSGLIHRDLKPSNIFVMEDDTAMLIDFGLVHSADSKSVTGYKGTWEYMAPEQTDGKNPTVASDIFSLGVVAYEALTGRKPFRRDSLGETVEAVRTVIPPAVSEINPKVSQLLSKVVHKAIAKQPMHRYASAREFAETLQKAYQNQPIASFDSSRILPRIERARRAFEKDDPVFASEILTELEAEGNVDPEITLLRAQIDEAVKQKRIRQLLESARTRSEQDEIPLALEKLREVLELDKDNSEASSMRRRIEEQVNRQQISDWMKLARQHLQLQDFGEARQALQEVLAIRYDDPEALQLRVEIDAQEKEAVKARAEKEQLYGSALKAYQGGEMSTALSKLEKILEVSRRTPGATIPERDAVYQNFYNRVRTERDSIDKAYEDGRRFLNEKEFQKALETCDQMLEKYPRSAQFKALKLEAERSESQERSTYIAEIAKSAESEPDLNRRVNIFEEACQRYPAEAQFQQSLRLTCEQRDLVQSISAKARQYEEHTQFTDAIGQWKILRNIHPQYPGLDVEIGQLEKRRALQVLEEKKARFVEQIDDAIENASYAKARQLALEALAEFPQDSELIVLEKTARQGLEGTQEAERLLTEGRRLHAAGHLEDATKLVQRALKLDERNPGMRGTLVGWLVERANSLLEEDWRSAESLALEALDLDEHHPGVKRLRMQISEAKRKDFVQQCLGDVRELQRAGDMRGAWKRLGEGLSLYPDEPRLLSLQNSLQPKEKRSTASNPLPVVAPPEKFESIPAAPPDPVSSTIAVDGLTDLYGNSIGGTVVDSRIAQPALESALKPVKQPIATPPVPLEPPRPSALAVWLGSLKAVAETATSRLRTTSTTFIPPSRRMKVWGAGIGVAVLLSGVVVSLLAHRKPTPPQTLPTSEVVVPITLSPSDATLALDGKTQTARTLRLRPDKKYDVTVSKLGFEPLTRRDLAPDKNGWKFALDPSPVHLQILTSEQSGKILLDSKEIGNLEQGGVLDAQLPADSGDHTLTATSQAGELFHVKFSVAPGQSPKITPLETRDLIAASSLGNDATVFGGAQGKVSLNLPGKAPVALSPAGTNIKFDAADIDQTVMTISDNRRHEDLPLPHGNAPTLFIALKANPNIGTATIITSVQNAILLFDGRPRKAKKPGYWQISASAGSHKLKLTADGYAEEERTLQIEKGKDANQTIEMTAASSAFSVDGGMAGAEVLIDNASVGTLDASGSLHTAVGPGPHQISIRKAGFEVATLQRSFAPGRPFILMGRDIPMKPFGTLNFAVEPARAIVQYRRADETNWRAGEAAGTVKVAAGSYEISVTAEKYEPKTIQVNVTAGIAAQASVHLVATATPKPPPAVRSTKDFFARPGELQAPVDNWYTGKTNAFLTLKPAEKYTFTFLDPGKIPVKHKPKRLEWRVSIYPDAEISYELDAHELTRRVKADSRVPKTAAKVNVSDGQSAYSVVVTLEPHGVKITKADGSMVDEFTDSRYDWPHAAISIKGDAFFVVR